MAITELAEPLKGTSKINGMPIVVLALTDAFEAVFVDDEGDMSVVGIDQVNIDWRHKEGKWIDIGEAE